VPLIAGEPRIQGPGQEPDLYDAVSTIPLQLMRVMLMGTPTDMVIALKEKILVGCTHSHEGD
jgi:hypothetical protein